MHRTSGRGRVSTSSRRRTRRSRPPGSLIVAASLGEPVAIEMEAWIAANPPRATTVALERALARARLGGPRRRGASRRGDHGRRHPPRGQGRSRERGVPRRSHRPRPVSAVIEPRLGVPARRDEPDHRAGRRQPDGAERDDTRAIRESRGTDRADGHGRGDLRVKFGARRPRRVLAPRRRRPFGPRPGGAGLAGRRGPHRRARSDRRPTRRVLRRSRSAAASPGTGATSRGSWTRAPMPWEPAVLQSSIVPEQGDDDALARRVDRRARPAEQLPAARAGAAPATRIAASSAGSAWSQPQTWSVPWVTSSRSSSRALHRTSPVWPPRP